MDTFTESSYYVCSRVTHICICGSEYVCVLVAFAHLKVSKCVLLFFTVGEGEVGIELCLSGFCGQITGKVSDGEYYHFYELNGAEGQAFHCLLLRYCITVSVVK